LTASPAETDPSVCYRHPDRSSWTLCQRCGRTICPECQILTPAGVRCPDCVRETGGSVQWQPAAAKPAKTRKTAPRRQAIANRVDASTRPVLTIGIAGTALVLWLLGFFTGNLPALLLSASPLRAVEVWRYATTSLVYPASAGAGILASLLGIAIFVWIGWSAERFFGWRRFGVIVLFSGVSAAAVCGIALSSSIGLMGAVWGIFGAYLIVTWDQPPVRNRILITMVFWLLFSLFFGNIFAVIGGAGGGIGTTLLLRRYDGRSGIRPTTPYLLLTAGTVALVALAILASMLITAPS
jgi:membrane associated rhomboid family serine protease